MLRNISLFVDYVLFDYVVFTFGSVALFNVKKVTCHSCDIKMQPVTWHIPHDQPF